MTTEMIDQAQPLSLRAYLQTVDAHLARLTCGLLTHRDFEVDWQAAWQAHRLPQQVVAHALAADGFVVSYLPTPMMAHLAAQQEVCDGQT